MNKVIDRERWIGTTATSFIVDVETPEGFAVLTIFAAISEDSLFDEPVEVVEEHTGMYL